MKKKKLNILSTILYYINKNNNDKYNFAIHTSYHIILYTRYKLLVVVKNLIHNTCNYNFISDIFS